MMKKSHLLAIVFICLCIFALVQVKMTRTAMTDDYVQWIQKESGLHFLYPEKWQYAMEQTQEGKKTRIEFVDLPFGEGNVPDENYNLGIHIVFDQYDEEDFEREECDFSRYEFCYREYEENVNLIQRRKDISENPTMIINSIPVSIHDYYYAGSANIVREADFFTSTHHVTMSIHYSLIHFLKKHEPTYGTSMIEKYTQIMGDDRSDPVNKLLDKYPDELRMQQRFEEFHQMLNSIEIIES